MIDSPDQLRDVLRGSSLVYCDLVALPVLSTDEQAFAVDINANTLEQSWRVARGLVNQTGRWPVVSTFWGPRGSSFSERLREEDLFSRFFFEEAPDADDVSPRALIQKSHSVDAQAFVTALARDRQHDDYFDESVDFELAETERVCGRAPSREEVGSQSFQTTHQLDRWLLEWELAHGGLGEPERGPFDWFEPDHAFLLFLPTPSSWETLAYLNWYGTSDHGTEHYIALGKSWEERFGVELVAHYGTMLQGIATRPPLDLLSAWEVAREHDLAAPCTLALPGTSLRQYAHGLVRHDRWFLHERP